MSNGEKMNFLNDLLKVSEDASHITALYMNVEKVMHSVLHKEDDAYDYIAVEQVKEEHIFALLNLYKKVLEQDLYLENPSWILVITAPFLVQPLTGRVKFTIGAHLGKILATSQAAKALPFFDVEGFLEEIDGAPAGGDSDDWLKWGLIVNYQLNTLDLLKSENEQDKERLKYKIELLYKHVLFEHELIKLTSPELLPFLSLSAITAACAYRTLKTHYGLKIDQNVLSMIDGLLPLLPSNEEVDFYKKYYNAFIGRDIHDMIDVVLEVKAYDEEIGSEIESLHLAVHNPGALAGPPSPSMH